MTPLHWIHNCRFFHVSMKTIRYMCACGFIFTMALLPVSSLKIEKKMINQPFRIFLKFRCRPLRKEMKRKCATIICCMISTKAL